MARMFVWRLLKNYASERHWARVVLRTRCQSKLMKQIRDEGLPEYISDDTKRWVPPSSRLSLIVFTGAS